MDHLWSPWRFRYVSQGPATSECIFCAKSGAGRDRENLVLYRGRLSYVLLNLYPYTNGHMLIAPYQHVATLEATDEETLGEIIRLARRGETILRRVYRAPGLNIGMNIGECAGAGVAGHLHLHLLPRWPGDTSFMTSVGETRVMPEDLESSWEKLRGGWDL